MAVAVACVRAFFFLGALLVRPCVRYSGCSHSSVSVFLGWGRFLEPWVVNRTEFCFGTVGLVVLRALLTFLVKTRKFRRAGVILYPALARAPIFPDLSRISPGFFPVSFLLRGKLCLLLFEVAVLLLLVFLFFKTTFSQSAVYCHLSNQCAGFLGGK